MRNLRLLVVAAVAATALPQDLPPGVLLLSKVKTHVGQQLKDLQNYTCLETIHRYQNQGGIPWSQDMLRLEVLYAGGKELYSAPGERSFSDANPSAYVSDGMSQNGLFGGYLYDIVVGGTARITYRGDEDLDGRRTSKYDFVISSFQAPLVLSLGRLGSGTVGIKGTFWADPETKDVLRLDIQPTEIPASLPVASALWAIRYAPVRIGERDIMVPQSADSQMELTSGQADRNILELTHCRAFEAESSISFETADGGAPSVSREPLMLGAEGASKAIPAGLQVTIALAAGLNEKTPIGTPIEARVTAPAAETRPRSGSRQKTAEAVIPNGALVRGRVRRIERQAGAGNPLLIALEFTDIETNSGRQRFFAELERAAAVPGIEAVVTAGTTKLTPTPDLPGVAYLKVREGTVLPAGFTITWKTQSLVK